MELSQLPQPVPLIVKCGLDPGQVKRIRYSDSRQLTFAAFQQRISTVLQLSPHKQHRIIYDDDDGEQCEIACDDTLAEAIAYFMPAEGQPSSISMRVTVTLVSTLTLSDFGGSEMDDGASDVVSSYWGSHRAPSAYSAGAVRPNVVATSSANESGSSSTPFKSYADSFDDLRFLGPGAASFSAAPSSIRSNLFPGPGGSVASSGASGLLAPHAPASHSYRTQSQWDELSSVSGSLAPGLPAQGLAAAAAAATQRTEAARAQVEEMERKIQQMKAIVELERRKLYEEEQWQLDLQQSAAIKPLLSARNGSELLQGIQSDASSGGKRPRVARFQRDDGLATANDSSEESEPESVMTISNLSAAASARKRASLEQDRVRSQGTTSALRPAVVAKGFIKEDEIALDAVQQRPRLGASLDDTDADPTDALAAGDVTIMDEQASSYPACSSCHQEIAADSLRYVCVICGPRRPRHGALEHGNGNGTRSGGSGGSSEALDRQAQPTVLSSSAPLSRTSATENPGAASTDEWSHLPPPSDASVLPISHRARTISGTSSDSSSSSSSNSSILSSRTQVSSSSSMPGSSSDNPGGTSSRVEAGFELCLACFQNNAARDHLQDPGLVSALRSQGQAALPGPQHAFFELLWQDEKWTAIEDELPTKCTHCMHEDTWVTGRFKCSSCDNTNLCGNCFKRVDDIHPPHVFIRMPVRANAMPSDPRRSNGSRSSSASSGLSVVSIHAGVKCAACGQSPITGTRWHCANCLGGRDFCGRCEGDDQAMAAQAALMGHGLDHLLIKIPAPLNRNEFSKVGTSLIRAQQRLAAEAERHAAAGIDSTQWNDPVDDLHGEWNSTLRINGGNSSSHQLEVMERVWQMAQRSASPTPEEKVGASCFNCRKSLQDGPRFICANCPLGQLTPGVLGLNLCEDCEKVSQELHDPSHFFIKIKQPMRGVGGGGAWTALNAHAIARLRARTGEDMEAPLLPILYKDAAAIATGPPVLPTRVRPASSTSTQRKKRHGRHRGDDADDEDAEQLVPPPNVTASSSSTTTSNGAWPLPQPIASTLAMARNGKFSTKAYQRHIQGAIRSWIKDTTEEFEMHRISLARPARCGSGSSASGLRACMMRGASRLLGAEETGTRSPAYVPVQDLVHPSILCDSCYECIEGAWYRCCSCKESFDLCSRCEARVEHDSRHVFAVFKQPVDMALFKSLIDHGTEMNGHSVAARPMLPVLLVGQDD